MIGFFLQIIIYLAAAIITVPLVKRLGLGSVLGYLIAGVLIGPVIGLVGAETHQIQHYAEFGIVMMLFVIGLELEPKMLWSMRHRLLGLGGLQTLISALIFMGISLAFGLNWKIALAIGFILAPSSTAIVMQTLGEKGLIKTEGGQSAFSVLLFQDVAIIPMLAIIPLLTVPELLHASAHLAENVAQHSEFNFVGNLPGWIYALVICGSIAGVIIIGHYLSRPLFKYVATSGIREIFTASALLLVIGVAVLMSMINLSPALGAFLTGVVLANSEFRHEIEADLEPFKGLLLGLFFITIGAGIQLNLLWAHLSTVILLTLLMMCIKVAIVFSISYLFKIKKTSGWLFSLSLAQTGGFSFVLINYARQNHALPTELASIFFLVVALSMFLTPILFILYEKVIIPYYQESNKEQKADEVDEQGTVIIAGGGRYGQVVNRLLIANGVKTTVLDHDAQMIDNLRRLKIQSYFGDVGRQALLHTAGIEKVRMLVLAVDNIEVRREVVNYVKKTYPHVRIISRAFDRGDAYQLKSFGANWVIPEVQVSAMETGAEVLRGLGVHPFKVEHDLENYRTVERKTSGMLYKAWQNHQGNERYSHNYIKLFLEYEELMAKTIQDDKKGKHSRSVRNWTPNHIEKEKE